MYAPKDIRGFEFLSASREAAWKFCNGPAWNCRRWFLSLSFKSFMTCKCEAASPSHVCSFWKRSHAWLSNPHFSEIRASIFLPVVTRHEDVFLPHLRSGESRPHAGSRQRPNSRALGFCRRRVDRSWRDPSGHSRFLVGSFRRR